ncbi:hypothetical protein [Chenggangzhangella methanolivorans]|uniref:Uncharacterized protein n=1 Tax=Chenggangzhangella methanolivorans TaxID=1437009 RepID=A0A9E6UPI7_9HYPH|nr:hypothetical protein [Chenggangzhangella methanolivorans]QZN99794.1 hypothetical protein K6K41_24545 [Chenggangzhangella methanolivorans]
MSKPSASQSAYLALSDALAPAFAAIGYPDFGRNVSALSDLVAVPAGGRMFATLRDAGVTVEDVQLSPRTYELAVRADLELIVSESDDEARDASFDLALVAVDDALEADRMLGETVADVEIEGLDPIDLDIEGAPPVKGAILKIRMLVTSDRPF